MSYVSGFLSALFWGLLTLSTLVVIHEGGHYLAARIFGMRVTEFFIGLPCRYRLAWKSTRHGTEFGITPFLLGGYNRICGMETLEDELLPEALAYVQRQGRVSLAQVAGQLGVDEEEAGALLYMLCDIAAIREHEGPYAASDSSDREESLVYETLQRDGSMLNEYDLGHDFDDGQTTAAGDPRPVSDPQRFFEAELSRTYAGVSPLKRIITLTLGPLTNILLALVLVVGSVMTTKYPVYTNDNVVGKVYEQSLAEDAGILAGDRLIEIGGVETRTWEDVYAALTDVLAAGEDFEVVYERDGTPTRILVAYPDGGELELFGIEAPVDWRTPTLPSALSITFSYMGYAASTIAQIVVPTHTMEVVSQSSSVVGISAMASEAAHSGLRSLLELAGAISLSLGFMNLLPIVPLDGGKIVLELAQVVIRRPIPTKIQNAISYVGLAFFLFIFVFALRNDIVRILGL